ncbi:hypothetical protein [Phenylobacterium sp.]|jgi:hypothetical protein|uniref:hypothetical protein n=1 Tax=Phenylobacterium sp. TaxID=1871053 RepID=UPI0025F3BF08|nr:hypothetical protein [Phenylobacterium sp.]
MDAVALASYIHKKIRELEENRKDYVSYNNVKTMEDYKFVMGELSMLRTLRDELKEALQFEGDPDE